MAGQSRKWMILVATIWIQAFTGKYNIEFSDRKCYVFLCCLLAGLSICWFNTVCFVLCIRNFPANRSLALSLTVSFNGVSAALYTLAYNAINPVSTELYLLLNALVPLFVSFAALIPILRQPPLEPLPPDGVRRDSLMFLLLNILAVLNGVYLLLFRSKTSDVTSARLLFSGSILLLILPLCLPGLVYARNWYLHNIHSSFRLEGSGFILVDVDELEMHKGMCELPILSCCTKFITRNQLEMLGEEHPLSLLLCRSDFWLYYIAYFCGGTIGLVYSNNLGQIAQSLGKKSETTTLVTLYSSFSFFGRLLSATPDYIRAGSELVEVEASVPEPESIIIENVEPEGLIYFARTGCALLPTTIALYLLPSSGSLAALQAGTALIGLSSAALVYESHSVAGSKTESVICMGRDCYLLTFVWWGCLLVIGLASSVVLFLRTRRAYQRFEQDRITSSMLYS
ncbi:predicted protein [Arabidopsis lyrata subsp. lyrata]|uniref:Predicted protein n=1 Tax=Arabidopsis lyrata subsp. lyrata TaxID=81972 RepID=D7MK90_ARALL|nr:predicted protein [Arabidopsis lyrata subsp. lyrata]